MDNPVTLASMKKLISLSLIACCYFSCKPPYDHGSKPCFSHSVASGDPQLHGVVLWTKLDSIVGESAPLSWEIATDFTFQNITNHGETNALAKDGFICKVIADQLQAGTTYYYRFKHQDQYSPTGRTRTLPEKADTIRLGIVNCSKYTGGFYNAYQALATIENIDAVVHLGDYIYESGPTTDSSSYWPAFVATGRQHDPMHECMTTEDYNTRYSQYKKDEDLQLLHERYPMIVIWDDHEIPGWGKKGDWQERKKVAIKAYHDWLPTTPGLNLDIYRSFQFGNLVNLLMVDPRHCCKDKPVKKKEALKDTSRHIIGNKQLKWIQNDILKNHAAWNVFGNPLLFALKGNGWERWQGYPYDRDRLLNFMQENDNLNYLFVTGNAHNPHHYIVMNEEKTDTIFHELLPGSISSGNNAEKAFYDPEIIAKEEERLKNEDNVLWFHQDSHGFIVLEITKDKVTAKWYFVSTIKSKDYKLTQPYTAIIKSKDQQF